MTAHRSDVAFTPAVKAAQAARGSREGIERHIGRRDWADALPEPLQAFVQARDSFYLGTASADGQPYIQHRGGPPGFLAVLDPTTLAFADYAGNRQYISVGNLTENDRVTLFLMDYPNRTRLKIWGRAEIVEAGEGHALADPRWAPALAASQSERVERLVVVHLTAWDLNCPKHITPRWSQRDLEAAGVTPR